jgi:hypothetical protein
MDDETGGALIEGMKNAYKILVGRPGRKSHLEDLGIDRRVILRKGVY